MELDTGSSVSVISEADYVKYFKGEKLEKSLFQPFSTEQSWTTTLYHL
jgi:hypothetical protein